MTENKFSVLEYILVLQYIKTEINFLLTTTGNN